MSKKPSTLVNMLLALAVIAVVAAGALAGVYVLTKDAIDKEQQKKSQTAMEQVLPKFQGTTEAVPVQARQGDKNDVTVNLAYNNDGSLFGAAVETYTDKAFGGSFTIMVGFDAEGTIIGTAVVKAAETPGLGDKIKTEKFNGQFAKKQLRPWDVDGGLSVTKDGGQVDAITAATISSRAFCDAVNRAAEAYQKVLNQKGVAQ